MIDWRFLALLLFVVPALGLAQEKCTLTGSFTIESGETYPYRMVIEIAGKQVKGFSVTTQDGQELKTKVLGAINKEKKILILAETSVVGTLPDSVEMCFINSVLKWKLKKGKYLVTGIFAGKDKKGNICSQGQMSLEASEGEGAIFKPTPKPVKAKDTTAKVEGPVANDPNKITDGKDKYIEWGSATCTLEIWDGGVTDGDVVTILLNNKEILTDHSLTAERKQISIPLSEKDNTITIVAGDEGTNSPNTAEMVLIDGGVQHRVTAFNKKGKAAKVIIKRK
jgi:hypothetical protein